MKKIKAIITDSDKAHAWSETFDIADNVDEMSYMNRMLDNFNSTLREKEKPRMLIGVEIIGDNGIQQHQFEKTNLVTIRGRSGMYDTYKCNVCGVTGKKYGIGNIVKRDDKFKAKCYENCTSALKHLTH